MGDSPYITSSNVLLDRPILALSNYLSGDIQGGNESIYSPDSLSLEERKKLGERLGLQGPLASLTNIVTNPLVLGGLALSLLFESPAPNQLARITGSIKGKTGPLRFMTSMMDQLRGSKIATILQDVTNTIFETHRSINQPSAAAITRFEKAVDRGITKSELGLLVEKLDDSFNPNSTTWKRITGRIRSEGQFEAADELHKHVGSLYAKSNSEWEAASPHLHKLHDEFRSIQDMVWSRYMKDQQSAPEMIRRLYSSSGFNTQTKTIQKALTEGSLPQRVDQYWHRTPVRIYEQELNHITSSALEEFGAPKYVTDIGRESRESFKGVLNRIGAMGPDPEYLIKRGMPRSVVNAYMQFAPVNQKGEPLAYTMNFMDSWRQYMRGLSVGRGFSLTPMTSTGEVASQSMGVMLKEEILREYGTNKRARPIIDRLRHIVIPQMMGGMSHNQMQKALSWADTKEGWIQWLKKPEVVKAVAQVPGLDSGISSITHWLERDPSSSYPGMGAALSRHFMSATIGLPNIISPLKNALQVITNVFPLAPEATLQAYLETTPMMWKYAGLRAKGISTSEALEKINPEFANHALGLNLEDGIEKLLSGSKIGRVTREVQDKLMSAFSGSELYNQMVTFEAKKSLALRYLPGNDWYFTGDKGIVKLPTSRRDPLVRRAAADYASSQTRAYMFGSGPLHQPSGTLEWWSPLRQFTTFPLRQAGLIMDRMLEYPGYLGRAMLTSGLLYSGIKETTGTDISEALLTGGTPTPTDYGPFAPLPVPPLLQLIGGAVMSASTGNPESLQRALPLLIPGGVGLSRSLPAIPGVGEAAGKLFHRTYADYGHRNTQGLVPVRTADGSLTGYYTDAQLAGRALGLGDVAGEQEQQLMGILLKQRTLARGIKQKYMDALYENDATSIQRAQIEWRTKFPHTELPMDTTDQKALHLRKEVTRLERMLDSIPPSLRPDMTKVVSTALAANFPEFMGLQDPGLLGGSTASARDIYRMEPHSGYQSLGDGSLHGVKLRDKTMRGADKVAKGGLLGDNNSAVGAMDPFNP